MDKQIGQVTSQLFEGPGLSLYTFCPLSCTSCGLQKVGKRRRRQGGKKVGGQQKGTEGCLNVRQESLCGSGPRAIE